MDLVEELNFAGHDLAHKYAHLFSNEGYANKLVDDMSDHNIRKTGGNMTSHKLAYTKPPTADIES